MSGLASWTNPPRRGHQSRVSNYFNGAPGLLQQFEYEIDGLADTHPLSRRGRQRPIDRRRSPRRIWIKIKNPHVLQSRCRTRSIKDLGHVRDLGPDVGRSLMWCFVRIFSGGRWEREISLKYVRFRMEIQHQAGMKFERDGRSLQQSTGVSTQLKE